MQVKTDQAKKLNVYNSIKQFCKGIVWCCTQTQKKCLLSVRLQLFYLK